MSLEQNIDPDHVGDGLSELAEAESFEDIGAVISAHPSLTGPATDSALAVFLAGDVEPPELYERTVLLRYLLSRCALVGADVAMQELIAAAPPDLPGGRHSVRVSHDHVLRHAGETYDARPDRLGAVLGLVRILQNEARQAGNEEGAALFAWCAGLCLHGLRGGDRQENLGHAVSELCEFLESPVAARIDVTYPQQVLKQALDDLVVAVRSNRPPADAAAWETMCDALARLASGYDTHVQTLRAAGAMHGSDNGLRVDVLDAAKTTLEAVLKDERAPEPVRAAARTKLGEVLRLNIVEPTGKTLTAVEQFHTVEDGFAAGEPASDTADLVALRIAACANLAVAMADAISQPELIEAQQLLQRNIDALGPEGSTYEWTRAWLVLGDLHARLGEFEQAFECYQRGGEAFGPDSRSDPAAEVDSRLGNVYTSMFHADLDRAATHYGRAEATWTKHDCPERWAEMRQRLARARAAMQTPGVGDATIALVRELEGTLEIEDPTRDRERNTQSDIGDLLMSIGHWEAAGAAYSAGIEAGTYVLARQMTRAAQRAESGQLSALHRRAARCLLESGRALDAVRQLDTGMTRLLFLDHRGSDLLGLLNEAETSAFRHSKLILAEVAHERKVGFQTPGRRTKAELSRVGRAAGRDLARILREAPALEQLWDVDPLADEHILACVPEAGALVMPIVGPDDSAVLVLPAGVRGIEQEHVVPVALTEQEIHHLLAGSGEGFLGWLRAYQHEPQMVTAGDAELAGYLWAHVLENNGALVWDYVVGPVVERLERLGVPRGAHVAFVADGPVTMLPLHTAWSRDDAARSPLAERYAVSYSPSLRFLQEQSRRAASAADQPRLMIVADPTEDLPYARAEAAAVQKSFSGAVTPLPGGAASRKRVEDELRSHTHVHLACHALYEIDDPMASSLLLAGDEELTARELLAQGQLTDLELVVLSACETALTDVDDAPAEPSSLTSVFFELGAAGVVGTLWAVEDVSGMLAMERFYAEHAGGASVPKALRAAQLTLRSTSAGALASRFAVRDSELPADVAEEAHERFAAMDPDTRPFEEPFFWAPFVCTGR